MLLKGFNESTLQVELNPNGYLKVWLDCYDLLNAQNVPFKNVLQYWSPTFPNKSNYQLLNNVVYTPFIIIERAICYFYYQWQSWYSIPWIHLCSYVMMTVMSRVMSSYENKWSKLKAKQPSFYTQSEVPNCSSLNNGQVRDTLAHNKLHAYLVKGTFSNSRTTNKKGTKSPTTLTMVETYDIVYPVQANAPQNPINEPGESGKWWTLYEYS